MAPLAMVSPFVRHRLDPTAPVSPPTVSFSMRHCAGGALSGEELQNSVKKVRIVVVGHV